MKTQPDTFMTTVRHPSPNFGMLAIIYTVLFNAGHSALSGFGIPFGVKPASLFQWVL